MSIWSSTDLTKALGVKTLLSGNHVRFNSNEIKNGDIFVALSLGKRPGILFLEHALSNGASACIVQRCDVDQNNDCESKNLIVVDDSYESLKKLAQYKRNNSDAVFVSITGSCGKTTTKDMLKHILSIQCQDTFSSYKNFNNFLGLPISLSSMPSDTKYAVFEIGTNNKGEIEPLTRFTKHHIAIITNIGVSHIGHFKDSREIMIEKSNIFENMQENGTVILNSDSTFIKDMKKIALDKKLKVLTFGFSKDANARIVYSKDTKSGTDFKVDIMGKVFEVEAKVFGNHQMSNIASVLLCSSILGFDVEKCCKSMQNFVFPDRRGKIKNVVKAGKKLKFLDKSYNASPTSVIATLAEVNKMQSKRKVFIFGHMLELGDKSYDLHLSLRPYLLDSGVDKVITIGEYTECLFESLPKNLGVFHIKKIDEKNIERIFDFLKDEDLVAVQGSNSLNLLSIISHICGKK